MLVFAYAQFTDSAQPLIPQAIIISLTFLVVQVVLHCIWCAGGAMLVAAVGGRPAERWLMRGLSVVTVLVVIWAILLG